MSDKKIQAEELITIKSQKKNPEPPKTGEGETEASQPVGIFDKFLEIITGVNSEERRKLRKLKAINNDLNQSRFKFYNYKKDLILPAFAAYFYDLWRMTQYFAKFFDVKNHSNTIKSLIFDYAIPQKQIDIRQKLEKESIEMMLRDTSDLPKTIEQIKSLIGAFVKSFDAEAVKNVNNTYNLVVDISNLALYDWYFLLHKFDSGINETNITYKPVLDHLDGKYVIDEIVALNDYIFSINLNTDWKIIYEYLKAASNDQGLTDMFKKFINAVKALKKDDCLTKIIRLITKDPLFRPKQFTSNARIVQDYIRSYQTEVQKTVQNCIKEINKEKINKLLLEIFRTTVIVRMKNYSQKMSDMLLSRGMNETLKFIEPMNYLKAFLLDICKGEIKPRVDLLIIKGTWESSSTSSDYSAMLDKFNKLSDQIVEFDNRCADEELYGKEIKKISGALKHDPKARLLAKKYMTRIDNEAAALINTGIVLFHQGALKIKALIEDYLSKSPKMIINFQKIKWEFPQELKADLAEIYKKMGGMITLLKNYIKEHPAPSPDNKTE